MHMDKFDKVAEVNYKNKNCKITIYYCKRPICRSKFSSFSLKIYK